jgi:hypothetical protein
MLINSLHRCVYWVLKRLTRPIFPGLFHDAIRVGAAHEVRILEDLREHYRPLLSDPIGKSMLIGVLPHLEVFLCLCDIFLEQVR